MRFPRPAVAAAMAAAALALAGTGLAARADAVTIVEYPLPVPGSSPLGIAAGADGNVWFTEVSGSRFGRVTPAGNVTDFSTGSGISTESRPWGIAAGPDGNVWFAEEKNRVGRIIPSLAQATEFSAGISPDAGLRGITGGPDGNVWFTEDGGARIGRITPAGAVTEFSLGITPGSRPQEITTGPDGNLWFTEMSGDRIGRITPAGVVTEFSAGISANSLPVGIAAGADGNLWFTELQGRRIGRITPAGVVTEFPSGLAATGAPRDIAPGPDGNLWFTDQSTGFIGRITTAGAVTLHPTNLAGTGRPIEITAGPGRDMWFTTGSGNHIARLRLDPAATTGGAGAVTLTGALVAGAVDPFGSATSHVVQYGPTAAYGSATASRTLPPGPAAVPVTAALTGLSSGTTYHYRVVASSAAGTSAGADRTFTTAGVPGQAGPPPGARPGTGADRAGPRVKVARRALVLRDGRVRVTLVCPLSETLGCRGRVRLQTVARLGGRPAGAARRTPLRLGAASFRAGAGRSRTVAIRVSRRGRALVAGRGRLAVRAVVTASDALGNRRVTTARATVRRATAPRPRG